MALHGTVRTCFHGTGTWLCRHRSWSNLSLLAFRVICWNFWWRQSYQKARLRMARQWLPFAPRLRNMRAPLVQELLSLEPAHRILCNRPCESMCAFRRKGAQGSQDKFLFEKFRFWFNRSFLLCSGLVPSFWGLATWGKWWNQLHGTAGHWASQVGKIVFKVVHGLDSPHRGNKEYCWKLMKIADRVEDPLVGFAQSFATGFLPGDATWGHCHPKADCQRLASTVNRNKDPSWEWPLCDIIAPRAGRPPSLNCKSSGSGFSPSARLGWDQTRAIHSSCLRVLNVNLDHMFSSLHHWMFPK